MGAKGRFWPRWRTGRRDAEPAVLDEPLGHLPGADGAGAAAHGLDIMVRQFADLRDRFEHHDAEAVALGDVLYPALEREARGSWRSALQHRWSPSNRRLPPQRSGTTDRAFEIPHLHEAHAGHDDDHGKAGNRGKVREGARRVACRSDDQAFDAVLPRVLEHDRRLELLEGAGLEQRALFRPVAVEGDEEVIEARDAQPDLRNGRPAAPAGSRSGSCTGSQLNRQMPSARALLEAAHRDNRSRAARPCSARRRRSRSSPASCRRRVHFMEK